MNGKSRRIDILTVTWNCRQTPENPSFEGGEWTAEGSFENRVVAWQAQGILAFN